MVSWREHAKATVTAGTEGEGNVVWPDDEAGNVVWPDGYSTNSREPHAGSEQPP